MKRVISGAMPGCQCGDFMLDLLDLDTDVIVSLRVTVQIKPTHIWTTAFLLAVYFSSAVPSFCAYLSEREQSGVF